MKERVWYECLVHMEMVLRRDHRLLDEEVEIVMLDLHIKLMEIGHCVEKKKEDLS